MCKFLWFFYQILNRFTGIHNHDPLLLSDTQKNLYKKTHVHQIYPEYYLIKVGNFNDIAKDSLDEWIYFLKNEEIKECFKARGLKKAKVELDVMRLDEPDRLAYEQHQDDLHHQASIVKSNYDAGTLDGIKQGLEQGLEQGVAQGQVTAKRAIALSLLDVLDVETIAKKTGLSVAEITVLKSSSKI